MVNAMIVTYMIVISTITTICALALFVHVRRIYVKHADRLIEIDSVLTDIAIEQSQLATNDETAQGRIDALTNDIRALRDEIKAGKESKKKPDPRVPYQ